MNNIELWKLTTDALLLLSLGWLCIRFLKAPAMGAFRGRIAELENSLRSLMSEAESSGQSLSEQLMRRQKDLERLLTNLEGAEQRLDRAVNAAEEKKTRLETGFGRAEEVIRRLGAEASRVQAGLEATSAGYEENFADSVPGVAARPEKRLSARVERSAEMEEIEAPEPPSFEMAVQRKPAATPPPQRSRVTPPARPLTSRIEKEVEQPAMDKRETGRSMERIFAAADEAMRAAREIHADQTIDREAQETVDTVRISRQAQEGAAMQKPAADPRLGVLGGIKRQTQVL